MRECRDRGRNQQGCSGGGRFPCCNSSAEARRFRLAAHWGVRLRGTELAGLDPRYFLGLLNARVLSEHFRAVGQPKQGGYVRFSASTISAAPIRVLDLEKAEERAVHDQIVACVARLLDGEPRAALVQEVERAVAALYGVAVEIHGEAAASAAP